MLSLGHTPPPGVPHAGREVGVIFVLVGVIAIATAIWRFHTTTRLIAEDRTADYNPRSAMWLGLLILVLGLFILGYLTRLLLAAH